MNRPSLDRESMNRVSWCIMKKHNRYAEVLKKDKCQQC